MVTGLPFGTGDQMTIPVDLVDMKDEKVEMLAWFLKNHP